MISALSSSGLIRPRPRSELPRGRVVGLFCSRSKGIGVSFLFFPLSCAKVEFHEIHESIEQFFFSLFKAGPHYGLKDQDHDSFAFEFVQCGWAVVGVLIKGTGRRCGAAVLAMEEHV
jgi:hypothetical protein